MMKKIHGKIENLLARGFETIYKKRIKWKF